MSVQNAETNSVGEFKRPVAVNARNAHRPGLRAPILVTGEVTGSGFQYELLVGFTRLGNLLGLLDRAEVPEAQRHRVWIGWPV